MDYNISVLKQCDYKIEIQHCRSVGTFARALDCTSTVRQPSLHMSAAAASRDITLVSWHFISSIIAIEVCPYMADFIIGRTKRDDIIFFRASYFNNYLLRTYTD